MNGLTGLAGTAGQIYSAATNKQPAAPKYNTTLIQPGTAGGMSSNFLIIGALAIVGLIIAVFAFSSKRGK